MNDYLQRVWANIKDKSKADNVYDALKEWVKIPNSYRYEPDDYACQLCDHEQIKHIYAIRNLHKGHVLEVGSHCILSFSEIAKQHGADIDMDALERELRQEKTDYQALEHKEKLRAYIDALRFVDPHFPVDLTEDKGLSPKQLIWACERLTRAGIQFEPKDFKVRLKKQKFYNQMFDTERRVEVEAFVLPALTVAQQRAFDWHRYNGVVPHIFRKVTLANEQDRE